MESLGAVLECCDDVILTDREIRVSIEKDLIKVKPAPAIDAYSSTAVDLTLHKTIRTYKEAQGIYIDPEADGYNYENIRGILTDKIEINGTYCLESGKLVLGWTNEYIHLPVTSRLAARIEGKSSLARIGLAIHLTAPTIHAGYSGVLQMEIMNHGPSPIVLSPGMRICQLIFETTLGVPEKGYAGQFSEQQPE